MIDLGIIEKIKKLKDKFTGESPEALQQIETWEKRLTELSNIDDFANLSTTKEIVSLLKSRLKSILLERALTKGLSTEDLRILDARETELRFVIERFLPSYASELEQIEYLIDAELTQ